MSCFEVEEDDLDMMLDNYVKLYFKELTYYGTSKTDQMIMIIGISQELNLLEKKLFDNYNKYIQLIKKDISDPNIYYLLKIFFTLTNLIIKMTTSCVQNKSETEEFEYKLRYLVGAIENFIDKILSPIDLNYNSILNLNTILNSNSNSNKIFKLDNSTVYLKKFIELNKNKVTSREKISKLKKFLNLLYNV